jgi:hypothetical protein
MVQLDVCEREMRKLSRNPGLKSPKASVCGTCPKYEATALQYVLWASRKEDLIYLVCVVRPRGEAAEKKAGRVTRVTILLVAELGLATNGGRYTEGPCNVP